jgi:hypothetical protein
MGMIARNWFEWGAVHRLHPRQAGAPPAPGGQSNSSSSSFERYRGARPCAILASLMTVANDVSERSSTRKAAPALNLLPD